MARIRRGWSAEARAAASERMRRLNDDPAFAARKAAAQRTPEARAGRAEIMRRVNAKIEGDPQLRAARNAALRQARQRPEYRAARAEQMRRRMAEESGLKQAAAAHATEINADPAVRKRQSSGRRGFEVPPGWEATYRILRRKVGAREAIRLVCAEQARLRKRAGERA